jgi:hypothetical protein
MCRQKDALLQEWMRRTTAYAVAVTALFQATLRNPDGVADAPISQDVEEARIRTGRAHVAYESHIAEHGC